MTTEKEQARRDAQAARDRGGVDDTARQLDVPIIEHRTHVAFLPLPPTVLPDGTRVLRFVTPDGRMHSWVLHEDAARELGQQLIAPSLHVPRPGEAPPSEGEGPSR